MNKKTALTVKFDELDKEVFENMPLVIPLIQSTFNKIADLVKYYGEEIVEIIEKQKLKNWQIDKKKQKVAFTPFINFDLFDQRNTFQINSLENAFEVYYMACLRNEKNKKEKREIYIFAGYLYNHDENPDDVCSNQIYFQVSQYDIKNSSRVVFPKSEYEKMVQKITNDNFKNKINHPDDKGDDMDEEYTQVYIKKLDKDLTEELFQDFKKFILIPFLKELDKR